MSIAPGAVLTSGPVLRPIASAGLANLSALAILICRNLLDGYYASQVSLGALAAFTLVTPITLMLIGLSQGVSVAAGTVLSTRLGAGGQITRRFIAHSMLAAALCGAALAIVLLLALPLGLSLYRVDPAIVADAREMATWQIAAMPILFLYGVSTALLRAMGDAFASSRAATVGLLAGVIATPLLVFCTPALSANPIVGISIGLQIGYGCTTLLVMLRLRSRDLLGGTPHWPEFTEDLRSFARIGLPVAVTNLVTLGAGFVITGAMADAGADATAAFGVVSRLDLFLLTVINAVILALAPFVGQNSAAGDWWRVRRGVVSALALMAMCWVVLGVALAFSAPWIATLFDLPEHARQLATDWLRLTAVAFFFEGVALAVIDLLPVVHRPKLGLVVNLIYLYAIQVPFVLFAATHHNAADLYWAVGAAQIFTGCACLLIGVWLGSRVGESRSNKESVDASEF